MKQVISVPMVVAGDDEGSFALSEMKKVIAKVVRGFAVFYDQEQHVVSVTHIPSGCAFWFAQSFKDARKVCLVLDTIIIGGVSLSRLSAKNVVRVLPALREHVVPLIRNAGIEGARRLLPVAWGRLTTPTIAMGYMMPVSTRWQGG